MGSFYKFLGFASVLCLCFAIYYHYHDSLGEKELKALKVTQNIIEEKEAIEKLCIIEAKYEFNKDTLLQKCSNKELKIFSQIYITIGVDLSQFNANQIEFKKDTVTVKLPEPSILYNIQPSENKLDNNVYLREYCKPNEIGKLEQELNKIALQEAEKIAYQQGLFESAKEKSTQIFSKLYNVTGLVPYIEYY